MKLRARRKEEGFVFSLRLPTYAIPDQAVANDLRKVQSLLCDWDKNSHKSKIEDEDTTDVQRPRIGPGESLEGSRIPGQKKSLKHPASMGKAVRSHLYDYDF
jgi:hypothetical protein